MKIFHVNQTFADTGGVNTYMLSLIQLLDQEGIVNIPVYLEEHEKQLTYNGVAYWTPTLSSLILILKAESPDVVLIHSVYHPEIISYLAQHYPTIAYMHGFYPVCPGLAKYYRRNGRQCERAFGWGCAMKIYTHRCASARRPDNVAKILKQTKNYQEAYKGVIKIIVSSPYMRDLYIQNGFDPVKIMIIPPYINWVENDFDREDASDKKAVLFVGRLEIEKGLPYLLKAMTLLPDGVKLRVAGDGTRRGDYERLTQKLRLADRVTYLGWLNQDQLAREYTAARMVVLPSLMESFSISGVEALNAGVPVVAFDVGGISAWLKDGEYGYLVPPLDVLAMAQRMNELLENDDLALTMGENGQKYVCENYSPDRIIDLFIRGVIKHDLFSK